MISVLVFLIITGLVGGGASVAAETSLPGDLLYSIKVGINEKVGEALASSAEAKAEFNTKLAARRMQETASLSVKGTIDSDTLSRLESSFEDHADRVAARIAELNSEGKLDAALEANSDFQSSLNAHEDILVRLAAKEEDESDKEALLKLAARAKSEVNASASIHSKIESEIKADGVQSAAEGKLKAAQNKVDEVRVFIDSSNVSVSAEVKAKAEARLRDASSAIAQGKIKIEAKAYGEAFVLFQKAIRLAQEAQMTVNGNLEIDSEIKIHLLDESEDSEESGSMDDDNAEIEVEGDADVESDNSGAGASGRVKVDVGL